MQKINLVEFRKNLSKYVGKARFAHESIAVTHHGEVVGGFVSAEALQFLEELEMKKDVEAFDRGMESIKRKGTISLEEFKNKLDV